MAHRAEHSIEFQAVCLRYLARGRDDVRFVPILASFVHECLERRRDPASDPAIAGVLDALRETMAAVPRRYCLIAGADLAHVGPRFGDPPVDERTRKETEEVDQRALEAARRGDANGWHEAIAAQSDATRICGWGATWTMLRCASPGEGRLLRYDQSDEPGGSMVSVAAMSWP